MTLPPRNAKFFAYTCEQIRNTRRTITGVRRNNGDTWEWDGEQWELIGRGGPPPRISGQLAFDGTGVVLFGGRTRTADGFRDLNDTWRLDGSRWVRMQ